MLENLKLPDEYDGLLFLAESVRNPPVLHTHHHRELELNLVVSGYVTYVVEGERVRFDRGTLLWFSPMQEHQLVDRSGDAQYYVVVFKPELVDSACVREPYAELKNWEVSKNAVVHAHLESGDFEILKNAMAALEVDGIDPDLLNRESGFGINSDFQFQHNDPDWLNAGLRHLLLLSWRSQLGGTRRSRAVRLHPSVRRALELLEGEDVEDETDLADLAPACGVSVAYLSRIFHKQVGVTLTKYRNSLRLARFWTAYRRESNETVLEAAFAAGFGSYAQFFRVFTEAYGVGPRDLLSLNYAI